MANSSITIKKFLLYVLRWVSSTPVLALCVSWLSPLGVVPATIIANILGAIIFFPIDYSIFKKKK